MKVVPLKDDKWRVFLDTEEYRTLLNSIHVPNRKARTHLQIRLEMRLMATSMRVDTVSGLRYKQFRERETPEGKRWVCVVQAKDSTEREAETRPRSVFIPNDLMDEIQKYANRRNIGPEDRLFKHTTRTIQRDVTRSANNAATKTGDEDFLKLSPHDLRRYFATHLLYRHEVQPAAVRMLGGWKSDEAMFEYLVLPDDVLFERLGDAGLLGTSYDLLNRHDDAEKIEAAASRLGDLVEEADSRDVEDGLATSNRIIDAINEITGTGTAPEQDDEDPEQTSLHRLFDEKGVADPLATAKAAYVLNLAAVAWAVTLAPAV